MASPNDATLRVRNEPTRAMFDTHKSDRNQIEKARRALDKKAASWMLLKLDGSTGVALTEARRRGSPQQN